MSGFFTSKKRFFFYINFPLLRGGRASNTPSRCRGSGFFVVEFEVAFSIAIPVNKLDMVNVAQIILSETS